MTKYDPALRDASGAYMRAEWTSYAQVGNVFDGHELTLKEYERVEADYIRVAVAFMREAGIEALFARGVECHPDQPGPTEGEFLSVDGIEGSMRDVLREAHWCRFEASGAYVHFGWDYYMYVGVPSPCPRATSRAVEAGLFVEPFCSPYWTA